MSININGSFIYNKKEFFLVFEFFFFFIIITFKSKFLSTLPCQYKCPILYNLLSPNNAEEFLNKIKNQIPSYLEITPVIGGQKIVFTLNMITLKSIPETK